MVVVVAKLILLPLLNLMMPLDAQGDEPNYAGEQQHATDEKFYQRKMTRSGGLGGNCRIGA